MGIKIEEVDSGYQEEQLLLDIDPVEVRVDGRYINLTKEQIELFEKLTVSERTFTLMVLEGHTNRHAYKVATATKSTNKVLDANAARMKGKDRVRNFMAAMSASRISTSIMSKEEMLEILTVKARAAKANLYDFVEINTEYDADGDAISSRRLRSPEEIPKRFHAAVTGLRNTKGGPEVILDNGQSAAKLIADLNGYNAAIKNEISADVNLTNSQQKILDKSLDEEY